MPKVFTGNSNIYSRLGEAKMIYMAKPQIGEEEKKAVMEVLDSGIIAQGPRVKAFEEGFATNVWRKSCCSNLIGYNSVTCCPVGSRYWRGR